MTKKQSKTSKTSKTSKKSSPQLPVTWQKPVLLIGAVIAIVLIGFFGSLANKYFSSTASVRNPATDHYHFRTVLVIDGSPVDFSADEYQQEYSKDQCDGAITEEPIHFHDNVNQLVHVHWDGMNGGHLLKNYGWNFIDNNDDVLGWRFDENKLSPKAVPIHGDVLPGLPDGSQFYVYLDSDEGYVQKNWDDFITKDFEEFFGKPSALNPRETSWLDLLFTPVAAHGGEDHSQETTVEGQASSPSEEDLKKVNNLLGDVVIFAQTIQPTDQQVKDAFASLVPLSDSSCGG